jgi:hypothetical protein
VDDVRYVPSSAFAELVAVSFGSYPQSNSDCRCRVYDNPLVASIPINYIL